MTPHEPHGILVIEMSIWVPIMAAIIVFPSGNTQVFSEWYHTNKVFHTEDSCYEYVVSSLDTFSVALEENEISRVLEIHGTCVQVKDLSDT